MRVSDAERQRVLDELRRHCRAGRLDLDEYADRVEETVQAGTLADLDHARRDLPMLRIDDRWDPDGPGSRRSGSRGRWPRWMVSVAALTTVMVFASFAALVVAAQLAWAAFLLGGWLVGVSQGRLLRRRR